MMDGKHPPLRTWFIAAHLVATHSNGISALKLQAKPGKTAWLVLHELRRSMVVSKREPLGGARLMRSPTEPRTMPSAAAKVAAILARSFVGGAVERPQGRAGRIRLSAISRKTSSRWLRPKAL
jgi:hypothetical protein